MLNLWPAQVSLISRLGLREALLLIGVTVAISGSKVSSVLCASFKVSPEDLRCIKGEKRGFDLGMDATRCYPAVRASQVELGLSAS